MPDAMVISIVALVVALSAVVLSVIAMVNTRRTLKSIEDIAAATGADGPSDRANDPRWQTL